MFMKLAILLAAATIGLVFIIRPVAQLNAPVEGARYFESQTTYKSSQLRAFVKQRPKQAAGYVYPVLFPLDLLFMICLGGFIATAALALVGSPGLPQGWVWLLMILPAAYVAADLAEDILLARFLTSTSTITDALVAFMQQLTSAKIVLVGLGLAQTALLALWALLQRN
jgi:hypothetical protein